MLVITDALNVIPGSCPVAAIALIYLDALATPISLALSGDLFGNHFKVHHIVARWRLVTLSAIGRAWRGMLKICNGPLRRLMARNATLSEESLVPVFRTMAGDTVKGRLKRGDAGVADSGKCSLMHS